MMIEKAARPKASVSGGGCAFPSPLSNGMTLRDYFAAQAMTSLIGGTSSWQSVAEEAYRFADAMIEAREASNA